MVEEDFSVPDLDEKDEDFGTPDMKSGNEDFGAPDLGGAGGVVPTWESGDGGAVTMPEGQTNQWGGNLRTEGRRPLIRRDANGKVNGYSTTSSMFVKHDDGRIAVIPTVVDGEELSLEDAARHYSETGEHWGMAEDEEGAKKIARAVHDENQRTYRKGWNEYVQSHWDDMSDEIRNDRGVKHERAKRNGELNDWNGNADDDSLGNSFSPRRDEKGKAVGPDAHVPMLYKNADGTVAIIPTVVGGKKLSQKEAAKRYEETGEYLGMAESEMEARNVAEDIFNSSARKRADEFPRWAAEHYGELSDGAKASKPVADAVREKNFRDYVKSRKGRGEDPYAFRQVAQGLFLTHGGELEDSKGNRISKGDTFAVFRPDEDGSITPDSGSAVLMEFTGLNDDDVPVFKKVGDGLSSIGAVAAANHHISDIEFANMTGSGEAKVERSPLEQVRLGALAETGDYERYGDTMFGTATAIADRLVPFVGRVGVNRSRDAMRHLANIYEGNLDEYAGDTEDEKRSTAAMDAGLDPIRKGETREEYYERIKRDAEDELKKRVMAKMESGAKLSETEQGVWDKIVKGGIESGGYALEFALSGGAIFKGAKALGWGDKAVRAATMLGSAVPVVAAESVSRYKENITPEYGFDDNGEFKMVAAPDDEGEAAYKAIGGAVFDTAVEVGLEPVTMGLLRLAGKPIGWALGKATPGALKNWGAKKFNKFMASETGLALRQINRAYHEFSMTTGINSPFGEMLEENVQAAEKVLNLDGKTSEYKGLQKEWNEFYDRQFNADTQWDIFYGLIAQLGIGAAKSTAEGVAQHISTADVRRDIRMALKRSGISDETISTLTPEQQKTLDHMWRHYSSNPDELKAKVKNLGISMRLAVDELTARDGLKMRQSLEQRGIAPEKFTMQTGEDGKPAFQQMMRFTPDGKQAPMNAMTDAAHGVTIADQGDGTFYVMNDFRGFEAIPAYSFDEAQKKADEEVVRNQSMDADNAQKAQYLMGLVQRQYAGRNVVSIPSEAALRWQVAKAVHDGKEILGITRADQLFKADGSLKQPGAGGFHTPDGHIVVILDNVPSPAEMERVLAHEATGHEGVESATGRGANTVEFIQNAQAEGFSRYVAGEQERAIRKAVEEYGMDEATARASVAAQMSTDEYAREAMARYAHGRLHQPTWYERRKHELNQRRRDAGENVPIDQSDLEAMLAEAEAQGAREGGSYDMLPGDSGVEYFEEKEGAADETGNGADEAQPQPEQGEERGQEAPQPEAGAEPGAQAPDAGVVEPSKSDNGGQNLNTAPEGRPVSADTIGGKAKPKPKDKRGDNLRGYSYEDYMKTPDKGGTADVMGAELMRFARDNGGLLKMPKKGVADPMADWINAFLDGGGRKKNRGEFIALFGMKPKTGSNDAVAEDMPSGLKNYVEQMIERDGPGAVADWFLETRRKYREWAQGRRDAAREERQAAKDRAEEGEALESFDFDELAAARDAMDEEFANALGVVEGADEADYAALTPASLQIAKSGDTIRFDHDRKSFVFGSFDAGSGVLVVYDEDVAGMEGGKFRRSYRVTENSIEEIDDGQGNEVRADADRAGDEKGPAGGGGEAQGGGFRLESVTAEQITAEEKKRREKAEVKKRQEAPLKGSGAVNVQPEMDLGQTGQQDLFSPIAENEETPPAAKENTAERPAEYLAWLEKYKAKDTDGRFAEWRRKQPAQKPAKTATASAPKKTGATTTPPKSTDAPQGGKGASERIRAGVLAERAPKGVKIRKGIINKAQKKATIAENDGISQLSEEHPEMTFRQLRDLFNDHPRKNAAGMEFVGSGKGLIDNGEVKLLDAFIEAGYGDVRASSMLARRAGANSPDGWLAVDPRVREYEARRYLRPPEATKPADGGKSASGGAPKSSAPTTARTPPKPAFKRGDRVFLKGAKDGQRVTFLKANADGTADVQVRTPGANRYAPEKVETRTVPMGDVSSTGMKDTLTGEERNAYRRGVAEQAREAMRSDPALQRIDAAYRAAKTDAERNALKTQFAERVRALQGGVDFDTPGIFTGTAADYANRSRQGGVDDGPSVKHIGTGEGSQVYGWGLYGSTVRGVAEGYAESAKRDKALTQDEDTFQAVKKVLGENVSDDILQAIYEGVTGNSDWNEVKAWIKRDAEWDDEIGPEMLSVFRKKEGALKKVHEQYAAREHLYEQTFFTNRAPGDESHLLKWYEPVSEEQRKWIRSHFNENQEELILDWMRNYYRGREGSSPLALDRSAAEQKARREWENALAFNNRSGEAATGKDVYTNLSEILGPQAASEFLYRAGIDGVKYPVDSYGGKGVKDGDVAGWNYVAFSDEHIRVDHKWTDGVLQFDTPELSPVTPADDAAYMDAVRRGDMETAQRMVREAAKERGYEVFGLHGTKGEFTVFDKKRMGSANDEGWLGRGFYFWDKSNRTYAEQYANGGKVMEVMLSMEEPYLIDKAEMERLIDAAERHDIKTLEDFSNEVKANGYDSVIDGDGQMLVFEPNQIKSADPVTYDDAGNVIPLSQRFNPQNEDIRFDTPELNPDAEMAYREWLGKYRLKDTPDRRREWEGKRPSVRRQEAGKRTEGESLFDGYLDELLGTSGATPQNPLGQVVPPPDGSVAQSIDAEIAADEARAARGAARAQGAPPVPAPGSQENERLDPGYEPESLGAGVKDPVSRQEIVDKFRELFSDTVAIRGKNTTRIGKYAGHYEPGAGIIRSKDPVSLRTIPHELGHHIDAVLKKHGPMRPNAVKAELIALGKKLYGGKQPAGGYQSEGFAEMVKYYLQGNEEGLKKEAPAVYNWLVNDFGKAHPDIMEKMDALRDMIDRFQNQSGDEAVRAIRAKDPNLAERIVGRLADMVKGLKLTQENYIDTGAFITKGMRASGLDWFMDWRAALKRGDVAEMNRIIENHPVLKWKLYNGKSAARAYQALAGGLTDLSGTRRYTYGDLGMATPGHAADEKLPTFKEIFGGFTPEEMDEFENYAIARIAKEAYLDKGLEFGLTKSEIAPTLAKHARNTKFRDALERYTHYKHGVLHLLVDAGAMSQEQFEEIVKANPIYVKIARRRESADLFRDRMLKKRGKAVNRRTGSGRQVEDIFDAGLVDDERVFSAAFQADLLRSLVNLGKRGEANNAAPGGALQGELSVGANWIHEVPNAQGAVRFTAEQLRKQITDAMRGAAMAPDKAAADNLFDQLFSDGKDILTVFKQKPSEGKNGLVSLYDEDGALHTYELPENNAEGWAKGLMGFTDSKKPNILEQWAQIAAAATRTGATILNPTFALRNIVRDTLHAATVNEFGFMIPGASTVQGIAMDMMGSNAKEIFDAMGIPMGSMLGESRLQSARRANRYLMSRNWFEAQWNKGVKKAIADFVGFSENGTRIKEFKLVRDYMLSHGASEKAADMLAGANALDITIDFQRGGEVAKSINRFIPFFNAGIQGLEQTARALGLLRAKEWQLETDRKRRAGRTVLKGAAWLLMLSLLAELFNRSDDDRKRKIDELKPHERWNYISFGDVRLPVPYEIGYIFSSIPRAVIAELYDGQKGAVAECLGMFRQTLPGISPTDIAFIGPALNTAMNEYWHGGTIVPEYVQKSKLSYDWYDERTSEFSKMLGKAMYKVFGQGKISSPAHIDAFMNGITGNMYGRTLGAIGGQAELDASRPNTWPVVGTFFRNNLTANRLVGEFYERKIELERKKGSGVVTDRELAELHNAGKLAKRFAELRKESQKAKEDKSLSVTERNDRLEKIVLEMQQGVRDYNKNPSGGDETAYKIEVKAFEKANGEYKKAMKDKSVPRAEREKRLSGIRDANPLMRDDVRGKISSYIKDVRKMESTQKKAQKAGRPTDELDARIERRKDEILDMIRAARK